MTLTLADGKERQVEIYAFDTIITIQGRHIPIRFISVPSYSGNRALLGVEFIREAQIILDKPKSTWF